MSTFDCLARLTKAAGRALTDAEAEAIFAQIQKTALAIKKGAPDDLKQGSFKGMRSLDAVIQEVAAKAALDMQATAARKAQHAELNTLRMGQREADIRLMAANGINPIDAISRLIANRADGKANTYSMESLHHGINADFRRGVVDTWAALGNDWWGFIQDPAKILLLVKELKGEKTGDALAAKGAKVWKDKAEEYRQRFNDGGGNIGKLMDWAFPQHHSQERVARAGYKEWLDTQSGTAKAEGLLKGHPPTEWAREFWINKVMPKLDRARYTDDAGRVLNDSEVKQFLSNAYDSISTNGYSDIVPGEVGNSIAANRRRQHREIHFKDAEHYIEYWRDFGEKTFPDILMGHIDGMSRDIALVEHFGADADANFQILKDSAAKLQADTGRARLGKVDKALISLDHLWNEASGKTRPIADSRISKTFDVLRNLNLAGKGGSFFLNSLIGDKVMMETMGMINNIPALKRWSDEMRLLNPANIKERDQLARAGLMQSAYLKSAMGRFGDDIVNNGVSNKLANGVMRISGMNAINEWRRGSFSLSISSALGRMVRDKSFAEVHPEDMHLLGSYGITEADFKLWKLADLEDFGHGNDAMLSADSIASIPDAKIIEAFGNVDPKTVRREAVSKLLGTINSESNYAIVEPGWRDRAMIRGNAQRGTFGGELKMSFMQFKSFPFAQFNKMWDVVASRPGPANKAKWTAALIAMSTVAGALTIEARDMLGGKDPRDMGNLKFGIASFFQGGALGIYGDFLYGSSQNRFGVGPLESAAGPTIGTALDMLTSTMRAGEAAAEGRDSHLMAHYAQMAKGFIPGSNLWYMRAAFDHLIFQNIQEALSPGYLASMQARTQKDYGQQWWWQPGQTEPNRSPDVGKAIGN